MIIYIHGFSSSGFGTKALEFKEYFKDDLIHLSYPTIPALAINNLEQLINSYKKLNQDVHLIGSSLGGFYSLYLSQKYDLKACLINPALRPLDTLHKYSGANYVKNYFDGSKFEFTKNHINSLKDYEIYKINSPENIISFIQKGDEVLNYKVSLDILKDSKIILEDGGNHSFVGINKYFEEIGNFLYN